MFPMAVSIKYLTDIAGVSKEDPMRSHSEPYNL